ncbi:MAG: hypothetical protein ABIU63_08825 [Chitinophagaceae bacterium]
MKLTAAGIAKYSLFIVCLLASAVQANAQTDADAIMMSKNNFCVGGVYSYSSWKNYWEGTMKRNNQNLGTVSTQMAAAMGNYGISSKLNVLFGIPYVQTKASAGTLHGQKGIQDLSLWLKYMPYEKQLGSGTLSLYGIGGISFPVTSYVADYQPLAIGMRSTNLTLRLMADYQVGSFFTTVSGSCVLRSKIKIDRDSYYTTEMHYSDEVAMPDAAQFNLRIGYRTERMIAEALLGNWTTLGGFDITRNNMPFPSNKMNMTSAGVGLKYNVKAVDGLSLIGGGAFTLAGRNVGQATAFNGGMFYILAFKGHKKVTTNTPENK